VLAAMGATICANGVTRGYRPTRETVENKHARAPPQLSHDYSALLSTSVTTAEGPKASPKVRKCGRKMRGCVMLGAGGHICARGERMNAVRPCTRRGARMYLEYGGSVNCQQDHGPGSSS
jgi:hypothetical protein